MLNYSPRVVLVQVIRCERGFGNSHAKRNPVGISNDNLCAVKIKTLFSQKTKKKGGGGERSWLNKSVLLRRVLLSSATYVKVSDSLLTILTFCKVYEGAAFLCQKPHAADQPGPERHQHLSKYNIKFESPPAPQGYSGLSYWLNNCSSEFSVTGKTKFPTHTG